MMISMPRAPQERIKPGLRFALKLTKIGCRPVVVRLLDDGRNHNSDRVIEIAQQFLLSLAGATKFQRPLPDIPRPTNLRSNVVVEVAGEMKNQITNTVSVRIRPRPDLLQRQRCRQLVDLGLNHAVVVRQTGSDHRKVSHQSAPWAAFKSSRQSYSGTAPLGHVWQDHRPQGRI